MDKYDEAYKYFMELNNFDFDEAVERAWFSPSYEVGGCLFGFVGDKDDLYAGCLTMVKRNPDTYNCFPELKDKILNDSRIPDCLTNINKKNLHVFVEYQREADKYR